MAWRRTNVQSMNDTRNITQDRQQDVDEEVGIAASLEEHSEGREDDGKNDLANVAGIGGSALPAHCAEGDGRWNDRLTML